jgi:hypothetical protein
MPAWYHIFEVSPAIPKIIQVIVNSNKGKMIIAGFVLPDECRKIKSGYNQFRLKEEM